MWFSCLGLPKKINTARDFAFTDLDTTAGLLAMYQDLATQMTIYKQIVLMQRINRPKPPMAVSNR